MTARVHIPYIYYDQSIFAAQVLQAGAPASFAVELPDCAVPPNAKFSIHLQNQRRFYPCHTLSILSVRPWYIK
jgi:hypothetical protein